jgi:hypothetical protein
LPAQDLDRFRPQPKDMGDPLTGRRRQAAATNGPEVQDQYLQGLHRGPAPFGIQFAVVTSRHHRYTATAADFLARAEASRVAPATATREKESSSAHRGKNPWATQTKGLPRGLR